jgi:hypothetical protein
MMLKLCQAKIFLYYKRNFDIQKQVSLQKIKCNMALIDNKSPIENQVLEQLAEIDRKISDLQAERTVLLRLLAKARQHSSQLHDVTRRNSLNRVLIENMILETLKSSPKALRTYKLFDAARILDHKLNHNTFRSYLHRLKARGLIEPSLKRGFWKLA